VGKLWFKSTRFLTSRYSTRFHWSVKWDPTGDHAAVGMVLTLATLRTPQRQQRISLTCGR
jgi:hypothetical protein